MKVFLVPNYYKDEAIQSGLTLELWLTRQGVEVAWAVDQRSGIKDETDISDFDLVISLGGDGTLLRAAHLVGTNEIPILGLSYGHVGFLTAANPEEGDILRVVSDALADEMHVSRRATLCCEVHSVLPNGEERVIVAQALNDLALTRGPLSDMVEFDICVSGIISIAFAAMALLYLRQQALRVMRFQPVAPLSVPIFRVWSAFPSRLIPSRPEPSSRHLPMLWKLPCHMTALLFPLLRWTASS